MPFGTKIALVAERARANLLHPEPRANAFGTQTREWTGLIVGPEGKERPLTDTQQ